MSKAQTFSPMFYLSALTFTVFSGLGTPAVAQEADTSKTDKTDKVEKVTVVAQRRSEQIKDVPIAVTAMPAGRIEEVLSGGGDVLALAGRAPGLNVESSNGRVAPRFYIRGLGNTDFDLAASQPVSVVMDDVVMENVVLKSFPIFDLQQIEVARGPQGTLYGRNTPAGIVHFRSVLPSQEYSLTGSASYGSFGSASLGGAVGGALSDRASVRASAMYRRRDDWVDNTFDGSELGEFQDLAGRLQVLFEPNENFSALLNVHGRSLDGTSTLFRANVLSTGSNDLNANFDRDRVSFNQGGGNRQAYDSYGASATLTHDFGTVTLTSISAYETTSGQSRGDIDGGVAGVGPGFIPFDADTQDGIDDLTQFTQEVRLASEPGSFNWQVGAFYFDSDLTITTVGLFFPPSTTVNHTDTSWAVFGQAGFDVTDALTVIAGVRYTDDDKHFKGIVTPLPVAPVNVSDSQLSWDLSAVLEASENVNYYARIASGYRAPSIQGRDVAFFAPPSVATSETIQSYEVGVKTSLMDRRALINAAVFYYVIADQQFSAIGGLGNFNQLVNAEEGVGYGFEIEGQFALTDNLLVTSAFTYNHTEIKDPGLAVAPCGSGQCTVLDPPAGLGNVLIDGNPFPQAPEFIFDITVRYEHQLAGGAALFAVTDWTVRGGFNLFLYESIEFQTDQQFEGGLRIGYRSADELYEIALFGRNITDEENVIGGIDFNNNTAFVNEPRVLGVSLTTRMN